MNTPGPASTTSVVPKVKDVQSEPTVTTQESPSNNKGNSNVSAQCVPNSQSTKVEWKAKPRNQGGHPDHINPIGAA